MNSLPVLTYYMFFPCLPFVCPNNVKLARIVLFIILIFSPDLYVTSLSYVKVFALLSDA